MSRPRSIPLCSRYSATLCFDLGLSSAVNPFAFLPLLRTLQSTTWKSHQLPKHRIIFKSPAPRTFLRPGRIRRISAASRCLHLVRMPAWCHRCGLQSLLVQSITLTPVPAVSAEDETRYTQIIDGILATVNLETVTRKKIRAGLEAALGGKDLSAQKVSCFTNRKWRCCLKGRLPGSDFHGLHGNARRQALCVTMLHAYRTIFS